MDWITIISLLVLGLGLLFIESFFIPGTTIVGLIGFGMILFGIYLGYNNFGLLTGSALLVATLIIVGVGIKIAIKKKSWQRFALKDEIQGRVNNEAIHIEIGQEGISSSALRPSGEALFEDKNYEVHTLGKFVDANQKIKVISIEHNKIFVQPLNA